MNRPGQPAGSCLPSPQPSNATSNPNMQQQQRRRGQQQQQPNRAQRTRFEAAILELRGHIYDLVGLRSTDRFTKTTQAVAVYVGHELGGDI